MSDRLREIYANAALTVAIAVGKRQGLFDVLVTEGQRVNEIAKRCKVEQRYVEEWLGAMVCGGLVEYDSITGTFKLSPDYVQALCSNTDMSMSAQSVLIARYAALVDDVCLAMKGSGGLPYSVYGKDFHHLLSEIWAPIYRQHLVQGFLNVAPGVIASLEEGGSILEIGCGGGESDSNSCRSFSTVALHRSRHFRSSD